MRPSALTLIKSGTAATLRQEWPKSALTSKPIEVAAYHWLEARSSPWTDAFNSATCEVVALATGPPESNCRTFNGSHHDSLNFSWPGLSRKIPRLVPAITEPSSDWRNTNTSLPSRPSLVWIQFKPESREMKTPPNSL